MSSDQQVMLTVIWTVVATLAATWFSVCVYSNFLRKKNKSSSDSLSGDGKTAASTETPSLEGQNYEVFLNFRGTDTRKTFTDHLYHRLVDVGVCVFRDNEELHVGEKIHPNLLRAIRSSKISIPIISPDYASSKWCLHELVQILECRRTSNQIVIPIFYHVDASAVRHQTGSFGKAFSSQKKGNSSKFVPEWKKALEEVASLKALELNNKADGYEGKLVKQIVEMALTGLNKINLAVPEHLVGVEEKAAEIMEKVDVKSSIDVQLVLIHGMSGIGKTTLAKFLYNQLSNRFQFCCFLEKIHGTPMQQLQKQLISNILRQDWPRDIYHADEGTDIIKSRFEGRKILLVLDDVGDFDQLKALIGRYDYFGLGSIMIITSRNRDVLNGWHVKAKVAYELEGLNDDQSLELLCKYALQRDDSHLGEFETVRRGIISTTGGLPLAIVVIESSLLSKDLSFWKETLKRLRRMPAHDVHSKLRLSFDALSYEQKQIFIDIACLFPSMPELHSTFFFMYMWDDCDYYPRQEIEKLKSLSLIKVEGGSRLTMHHQLRLLGKEIVRQESPDLPGRQRIQWDPKEASEIIKRNQGTEQIEVLNLALDKSFEERFFTSDQFERLTKLRLLQLKDANLVGNFTNCFLNLRWLQWYGCPSNFVATGFLPKNLVVLNLSKSNVTEDWGGWKEIKCAEKLKVLRLCECLQLKATPDFSAFKELEILDFFGCKSLRRIHPSIYRLTKTLKSLTAKDCINLDELPKEMGRMEELRELHLGGTSIREITIVEGFMTKLKKLFMRDCKKLARLPDSIGSLKKLRDLYIDRCVSLTIIPESVGKLESLYFLSLSDTNIKELPESIGYLNNLSHFKMNRTPIIRLPATIGMLEKLRVFDADTVHSLIEVPKEIDKLTLLRSLNLKVAPNSGLLNLPGGLTELRLSGGSTKSFPNLSYLTKLGRLSLIEMDVIPELPSSLRELDLCRFQTLPALPKFSDLKDLYMLTLERCNELMDIDALEASTIGFLRIDKCGKISTLGGVRKCLERLYLASCDGLKSIPDLSTFVCLRRFQLVACNNVVEIQISDTMKYLDSLEIHDCSSLERISGLSHLTALRTLKFGKFPKLRDFDYSCIEKLTSLTRLWILGGCPALKFPDLSKLRNLDCLVVEHFQDFEEIPKLQELKSLRELHIIRCKTMDRLPDFSEFKGLRQLLVCNCEKLSEIQGLENLAYLEELHICGCQSLRQFPAFPEDCRISDFCTDNFQLHFRKNMEKSTRRGK